MTTTTLLYLLAGVLFILGLRGLGSPRTARRGNLIAAVGMLVAVLVTVASLIDDTGVLWWTIGAGLIIGGAIGAVFAVRVQMTAMPQLVAAFNGFGGGASALALLGRGLVLVPRRTRPGNRSDSGRTGRDGRPIYLSPPDRAGRIRGVGCR